MIGQSLGRYRILEKIGEGGMGVVYRAHDTNLDRDVALKLLPEGTVTDENSRKQFRKEALALAKLNHPNIASVYDFDTQQDVDFLVMEHITGTTLGDRLTAGALQERDILRIGTQLAEGLAAAHDRGVIHRDLKPGNLMLTSDGRLKILDFGLARLFQPESKLAGAPTVSAEQPIAGTLPYMAPEQLRGDSVDARTDIYAAGNVLYELSTGRLPFSEKSQPALIDAILNRPCPQPGRLRAEISPRLEEIILKCLEKDPENRYQSAKELAVDLRRLAASSDRIATAPVIAPARTSRRWLIWAGAAVVVLAAAAIVLWRALPRSASPIDSVAVLPFANETGNAGLEYLTDGIAEELINELTHISGLRVIARPTAFLYKGPNISPAKVGKELNVRAVVMGRVAQRDSTISVQVDVVNTSDGSELWGGKFERDASQVPMIQQDIVRDVAQNLRLRLSPDQVSQLARRQTSDPEAYRLYLRGRHDLSELSDEGKYRDSVENFKQALAHDPSFALGWAGLADAYSYMGILEYKTPREVAPLALEAARKSLALDPQLPEAHTSLGIQKVSFDWDFDGADAEFRRTLELNPGDIFGRHWRAHLLEIRGRLEEASAELHKVAELDPLSPMYSSDVAQDDIMRRRPQEVIDMSRNWPNRKDVTPFEWASLALAYEMLGRREECLQTATKFADPGNPLQGEAGGIYARLGKRAEAEKILAQLTKPPNGQHIPSYSVAVVLAGLGERDRAISYLNQAYEERSIPLLWVAVSPEFDLLYGDPRYAELLRRMNLPVMKPVPPMLLPATAAH